MSNQDDQHVPEQTERREEESQQASKAEAKRPFVEPELSAAVNVFDATTFFLQGSSVDNEL